MTNTRSTPRIAAAPRGRTDESRAPRSQNKTKARHASTIAVVQRVKHERIIDFDHSIAKDGAHPAISTPPGHPLDLMIHK